jgi:hypothetical protein
MPVKVYMKGAPARVLDYPTATQVRVGSSGPSSGPFVNIIEGPAGSGQVEVALVPFDNIDHIDITK